METAFINMFKKLRDCEAPEAYAILGLLSKQNIMGNTPGLKSAGMFDTYYLNIARNFILAPDHRNQVALEAVIAEIEGISRALRGEFRESPPYIEFPAPDCSPALAESNDVAEPLCTI